MRETRISIPQLFFASSFIFFSKSDGERERRERESNQNSTQTHNTTNIIRARKSKEPKKHKQTSNIFFYKLFITTQTKRGTQQR